MGPSRWTASREWTSSMDRLLTYYVAAAFAVAVVGGFIVGPSCQGKEKRDRLVGIAMISAGWLVLLPTLLGVGIGSALGDLVERSRRGWW